MIRIALFLVFSGILLASAFSFWDLRGAGSPSNPTVKTVDLSGAIPRDDFKPAEEPAPTPEVQSEVEPDVVVDTEEVPSLEDAAFWDEGLSDELDDVGTDWSHMQDSERAGLIRRLLAIYDVLGEGT